MRIAHVRERHAPAGAPWRLAAALTPAPTRLARPRGRPAPRRSHGPRLAHNATLFRQPVTTLDDHLARGLRVEALRELVEGFVPRGDRRRRRRPRRRRPRFGPPILRPPSFRDFYAFERHVGTMWERRGGEIPEAWYRLPIFYFSNVSEIRGPDDPVWAPRGSAELDYELEVGALVDTPVRDLTGRARRGGDRRLLRPQRLVGARPPARRDDRPARAGQGQGLRDLDRAVARDARTSSPTRWAPGASGAGPRDDGDGQRRRETELAGAGPTPTSASAQMLERASADVRLRPGDILGSGTVGGGCLLEIRDETLGR